jgi:imidazolonepropionase-like amidohydrolase
MMNNSSTTIFYGRFVHPEQAEVQAGYLQVRNGHIVSFSPEVPNEADVVHLEGWVVPGLIDAHVHLALDGGPDPVTSLQRATQNETVLQAVQHLKANLMAGVTTVRDLGGPYNLAVDLSRAVENGRLIGPRVVACGHHITMTGGHGHAFGREADGPEEVRRAARAELKAGAQVLKFMATGGVLTQGVRAGAEALTVDELRAGVEEAHKADRLTASHAQGLAGITNALRAGIDTIEHGAFDRWDDTALALMTRRERPVWLVPTLSAPDGILHGEGRVPEWVVTKTRPIAERHRATTLEAYQAGVTLAAGTDAGTPLNPHGGLARELELMAEIGLPLAVVLRAATTHAAAALGLADHIGTFAVDAAADFVVLETNPLEDVTAYRQVQRVYRFGHAVATA